MHLTQCVRCKMSECFCRRTCLHFHTGCCKPGVHIAAEACHGDRPACQLSKPPPSLSQILCNDVIQWADHVTRCLPVCVGQCRSAEPRSACVCSASVTFEELKLAENDTLCRRMVVVTVFCEQAVVALHRGSCRNPCTASCLESRRETTSI